MDQIVHSVRRFDRFTLDLTRGCVRGPDDSEIELRPKVFEVLCYLSGNAGRLVPKRELVEAVWPNVVVSDDSIVQCIRELREKLGDTEHRLIRTVARRGYLLDAKILAPDEEPARQAVAVASPGPDLPGPWDRMSARVASIARTPLAAGSAALLACLAILLAILYGRSPEPLASRSTLGRVAPSSASALSTFRDCSTCPEMVALPAGEFLMGSPKDELGRVAVEGLPRRVTIAKPIALGRFEVTVEQFQAFLEATDTPVGANCRRFLATTEVAAWGPPHD
jgi:DNA-binding winged helix-turn-helix (wHTH) protein